MGVPFSGLVGAFPFFRPDFDVLRGPACFLRARVAALGVVDAESRQLDGLPN